MKVNETKHAKFLFTLTNAGFGILSRLHLYAASPLMWHDMNKNMWWNELELLNTTYLIFLTFYFIVDKILVSLG